MESQTRSPKAVLWLLCILFIAGCSNDDNGPDPMDPAPNPVPGDSTTYSLVPVSNPDISGTATFIENSDGTVTVELELQNSTAGGQHPAHIHLNTAAEGGGIVITLGTVDGSTGLSSITISSQDDGTPITYDELLEFDGYINVHQSNDDLGTLLAQGDIGQNKLTGTSKTYMLGPVTDPDISGTATFEERMNGEALATIQLNNTLAGGSHPSHIHSNSAAEGGGIVFTFNPIDGDSGSSRTNVAALDDDTPFGYDDVLEVDGYINVHLSAEDLGTLLAQGDIGQNELTGIFTEYPLASVSDPDIEGSATFFERVNGEALAVIDLVNTTPGASHPAHIHNNSAEEGGDIVFTFIPVNGDNGTSGTNVAALDDTTPFGYDEVLVFDGYINVHLSEDDLGTLVAQGNIGSNIGPGEGEVMNYDVTSNGLVSYVFNGNGLSDSENPDLSLVRGQTYTFTVDASGHPFFIKSVQGNSNANAYNNGVTNNGTQSGTITFEVPMDAPDILYYNCQFHEVMTGQITITD